MTERILSYEETFAVDGCEAIEIHQVGERVMDELLRLEGGQDRIADSAVSTDSRLMQITVELTMVVPEGMSEGQALIAVSSAIRTSFHAIGGSTPTWPTPVSVSQSQHLEPVAV